MIPVGHIISVTASASDRQVMRAVLKIAGSRQMVFGITTEDVSTHLFVIPESKKSTEELATEVQAVPGLSKVAIVALSKPVNKMELAELRELFAGLDWDASSVTDDELSLFIDDKLLGQYTYYIELGHKRNESGMVSMRIKRLEDHPQFSPDWLVNNGAKKDETQNEEQTFDDIETHEVMIELIQEVEEVEEPPPPPPRPTNLEQMTDMQIKNWMRKNDARILRDEDVEIKRTSEEVLITTMVDGETETVIYKLTT